MVTLEQLIQSRRGASWQAPARLLAIDPGHTTGLSLFKDGKLSYTDQIETVVDRVGNNEGKIDYQAILDFLERADPTAIVCEDYRVYAHKLERHAGSQVLTIRIIGFIEGLCQLQGTPIYYQMAAQAKGFVTDQRLKEWHLYDRGSRHSRDSMRHAIYWMLFGKE